MAIVSVQELASAFPDLDLDNVQSSIMSAQILAEGINGANRPLEKTVYTETPRFNYEGIVRLARYPIDQSADLTVSIRTNADQGFQLLDEASYVVDYELEQIQLINLPRLPASNFSVFRSSHFSNRNYLRRRRTQTQGYEIKVTYTAGFDFFESPLSPEAQEIKQALLEIVQLKNSQFSSGLKQFNVTDFVSNTFSAELAKLAVTAPGNTILQDYLDVFKRYRPKEFVT